MSAPSYAELVSENARLKSRLAELQRQGGVHMNTIIDPSQQSHIINQQITNNIYSHHGLTNHDIFRYSRQLLVPELGSSPSLSQRALLDSAVLVVGAGGLGCPVILYLVAAGVGRIGIVDNDVVDESNLHRQICHSHDSLGQSKAQSAAAAARKLNPHCRIDVHSVSFDPLTSVSLLESYDVLVDCSDNVATRYLCNDVCILSGKPCVSGSALRMEGQLTIYGYENGPCYRCLYPRPPPAATVTNCSDGGVIGAITGVIGTMQAMEVLKICILKASKRSNLRDSTSQFHVPDLQTLSQRLVLYDGATAQIRTVRLRGRSSECAVCSDKRSITLDHIINGSPEYLQQCGTVFHDRPEHLNEETPQFMKVNHITVKEFKSRLDSMNQLSAQSQIIIDVRSAVQYDICQLPQSVNIPLKDLQDASDVLTLLKSRITCSQLDLDHDQRIECFVLCRRGLDSIAATSLLNRIPNWQVNNVSGGLVAWAREIDPTCPIY